MKRLLIPHNRALKTRQKATANKLLDNNTSHTNHGGENIIMYF
jgi:hypothetical protein